MFFLLSERLKPQYYIVSSYKSPSTWKEASAELNKYLFWLITDLNPNMLFQMDLLRVYLTNRFRLKQLSWSHPPKNDSNLCFFVKWDDKYSISQPLSAVP